MSNAAPIEKQLGKRFEELVVSDLFFFLIRPPSKFNKNTYQFSLSLSLISLGSSCIKFTWCYYWSWCSIPNCSWKCCWPWSKYRRICCTTPSRTESAIKMVWSSTRRVMACYCKAIKMFCFAYSRFRTYSSSSSSSLDHFSSSSVCNSVLC